MSGTIIALIIVLSAIVHALGVGAGVIVAHSLAIRALNHPPNHH